MTSPIPSEPRTGHQLYHAEAVTPVDAAKLVGLAIFVIYATQIGLVSAGVLELVAAAIADAIVLACLVGFARARGLRAAHFGLVRAPPRLLLAGVLIGLSAWYLNLWVVVLIEPPGDASGLQRVVEQTPLVATLVTLAVLPAFVEELVFRGVLARALARSFTLLNAVGISAAVFGLYHLLPAQMISTFLLGLALAFVTLRGNSVLPAMVAHLLNNVIAILISRDAIPGIGTWMSDHRPVMLASTSMLLGLGLWLAAKRAVT